MTRHTKTTAQVREVYFIRAEKLGLIKIGVTNKATARLASLQTFSPDRLTLLGMMICGEFGALEKRLHERFFRFRSHGEWYHPAPEVMAFIEANALDDRDAALERWALSSNAEIAKSFGEAAARRGAERAAGIRNVPLEPHSAAYDREMKAWRKRKAEAKASRPVARELAADKLPTAPASVARPDPARAMSRRLRAYFERRGMLES